MLSKPPKNTDKYHWTSHVKFKMQFYGLSAQKVLGVIKKPKRKEEGIVKNTVAVMQPISPKIINNKTIWKQEVWVMYQKRGTRNGKRETKIINTEQFKIISAWRYPGVSPEKNPIPDSILEEIQNIM
jgi:hypothetical protein